MAERWHLKQGNTVLGTLELRHVDQPWFVCHFEPTEAFTEVKALFEEELRLLNTIKMEEWQKAYEDIDSLGLRLQSVNSQAAIEDFLIHIEDKEAWFRY